MNLYCILLYRSVHLDKHQKGDSKDSDTCKSAEVDISENLKERGSTAGKHNLHSM